LFEYLKLNTEDLKIHEEKKSNDIDIDQRAIRLPCSSHLIRNYDKDQVELKFKNSYFVCNVCFTDKQGNDCMKFNQCGHVFCNECMKGYFESQITSGNINSLNCPQDKCDSQALQNQVLNLVGIDLFNRYDNLLLKDSLNNMSDIVYCPRVNCQSPVIPVIF
jgi:E3 ubiquitin-protein ligase RNF14